LALTTTEFLYTLGFRRKENTVFDRLDGKRAIKIQSVSLIDNTEESRVDPSVPLIQQKHAFYFTPTPEKIREEWFMNGHYNRYIHCIRDFANPYWLGRHSFKHPSKPSNLHILKFLYAPYPEFFSRKLQITAKIPESNKKQGWGHQHILDMPTLCSQYEGRKQLPLLDITDMSGQMVYYDKHMRNLGEETLLCGIYMNLYGESIHF